MIPKRNTNNVKSSNFYLSDLYLLLYKILDIYIHTLFYTPSQITQLIQNGQVLIVAMRSMSKLINKKIMIYNRIFSFFSHLYNRRCTGKFPVALLSGSKQKKYR